MDGVAYAVVHSDPPDVYLADTVDVLSRVLALEVVARTNPTTLRPGAVDSLRTALLEERWADALSDWIDLTGTVVDVYTYLHVYSNERLPPETIGAQLQFAPLFRD
ncbi:MAG: hypothetical protein V3V01_04185 [Acidimicrobiales bacterium]